MNPRRILAILATGLLIATLPASGLPAQSPAGAELAPCEPAGVAPPALCGTLLVPEDRAAEAGRTISLRIVVLRATGSNPQPDPLFVLMGGPGSAAAGAAAGIAADFAAVRAARDIVLVDQRGTGGSNALDCDLYGGGGDLQTYLGDWYPPAAVRECRADVEGRADPGQYTTTAFIDDLEAVRGALGYQTINLFGVSYGTRAAQEYIRRYPHRTRAAVLQGVLPPDVAVSLTFSADAQRALDGIIAECAAEPACAAAFPHLADQAVAVFERLADGPAPVLIAHPETGAAVTIALSRDLAAEAVRYLLYGAGSAELAPLMLARAAAGDLTPLAEYALFWRRNLVGSGSGLYLSVTCAEDLPRVDPAEGARIARGTFLGDYRVRAQLAACAEWPTRAVPAAFHEPVHADVPVLLVSGEWDPVTPPANGEHVARTLPNARHLIVPSGAHGFDGLIGARCVTRMIAEFFHLGGADGLDASCVAEITRPPFPTAPLPMRPVAVPAETLRRLAGTYTGDPQPIEFTMEPRGDGLLLRLPDGQEVLTVPVAPDRFRVLGLVGHYLVFEQEEGGVQRATLENLGVPLIALRRSTGPGGPR